MKIEPYLRDLVVKSYLEIDPATRRPGLLDCSLGVNLTGGVSERVIEAAGEYEWAEMWHYNDPLYKDLKAKIREFWCDHVDLGTEQIQIGHGASAILDNLNKIFVRPGSRVLGCAPQWPDYSGYVSIHGGSYEAVALAHEEGFKFRVEMVMEKLSDEHCLVYIDNPNNPTGQLIGLREIEQMLRQAQKMDVVIVIDEAYGDYAGKENSAVNLVDKYKNLAVVRSFSKGLGLAGLRIGYGVFSSELSCLYGKIAIPVPVSGVSSYLAQAALSDANFIQVCRRRIRSEKAKLLERLRNAGYVIGETFEECPIFLLGHKDNRTADLKQELLGKNILSVSGQGFKNLGSSYVRINTPAHAEEFLSRL
jgi:histidinol-phosphate aminotransferase